MASVYQVQLSNFRSDSILCFVIIFIFIWPSVFMHCLHDSVQDAHVMSTHVPYHGAKLHSHAHGERKHRHKREGGKSIYEPIRIKAEYSFGTEVVGEEIKEIKQAVGRAIQKSSDILSVVPVVGPLLLSRKPCTIRWTSGINKGKCSQFDSVKPEYCMDYFKIPKSHLKGYSIYNSTYHQPYYKEADGTGIENTDFILYITAQVTRSCLDADSSVIAYATYCQVDQNHRPVAGQINFCPSAFRQSSFSAEKFYWIALHELFHALGFSKSLFDKFRKCDKNGKNCSVYPSPVLRREDELIRLTTPIVSRTTQEHFQCFKKNDYGGPMDIANTSHWDSRTMQGSLMTAKSDMPHLTFIDKITLAVFEDSGWYEVDYSQADVYLWGREAGCEFGLPENCKNQPEYFCQGESKGCHFLHWDKATCTTYENVSPCGIFWAGKGNECWKESKQPQSNVTLEVFSHDSRCFLSNITKTTGLEQPLTPRCFHAHCYDRKTLMVRVDNSSWTLCPAGEYLKIPSYDGYVQCPSHPTHICSSVPRPLTSTVATTSTQSTTTMVTHTVPYHTHRVTTEKGDTKSSSASCCSCISISAIIITCLTMHFTHSFRL